MSASGDSCTTLVPINKPTFELTEHGKAALDEAMQRDDPHENFCYVSVALKLAVEMALEMPDGTERLQTIRALAGALAAQEKIRKRFFEMEVTLKELS